MVHLKAIEAGADGIDTAMSPLALGTSHPATESMVAALKGTEYDTGLDIKKLTAIRDYFNTLREKYLANGLLDPKMLSVDANTLLYQVPGGMLSNLVSQLKQAGKADKLEEVLREVPRVREDSGYPPLVTPTSQIVGTQSVFNVIMGERYKMVTKEFKDLVAGKYGKTPMPINEEFRKKIVGDDPIIDCRPADLLKPEYKGYIRMANPNSSGTAYNVLTTMCYVLGSEDAMMDYMTKLDQNIDQYTRSGSAPGKSVATGEIPVAIGYAHDQVKLKAAGANISINAPSEGTGFELASMSLVAGGPDMVNAKKLYDWILSDKDAQKIFTEWYVVLVANGAEKHPDALSIDQIKTVKQDFAWDGDPVNKTRLLDRWTNEIGNKR